MTSQSGALSPSPNPSTGSLLPTDAIVHVGEGSMSSTAVALTVIPTIWWFGGQSTAVLDVNALDGQSPAPQGSLWQCATCGPYRPIRYVVMPRSEVNRASGSRFNRVKLEAAGDRVLARTIEMGADEDGLAADVVYEFTSSLDLITAAYSARYWDEHRVLEIQGKLDHSGDQCPDRDGPRELQVWEPETGWRTVRLRE